ncbi:hypothetical protein RZS08_02065, partial [Arthrospira platensis SPKY1]|nr:hypothetical protein [Arthrospira platensis SPKY1]
PAQAALQRWLVLAGGNYGVVARAYSRRRGGSSTSASRRLRRHTKISALWVLAVIDLDSRSSRREPGRPLGRPR